MCITLTKQKRATINFMNGKYIELLNRQLIELEKIGTNPYTVSEWSFGVEAWKCQIAM